MRFCRAVTLSLEILADEKIETLRGEPSNDQRAEQSNSANDVYEPT